MQLTDEWIRFQQAYVFRATGPLELLLQTMQNLQQSYEMSLYTGVEQELANPDGLGMRQDSMLIVRIPGQSSGAVTLVRSMLLLMNFVEGLTSHTFSGGSIVTQFVWKSKDLQNLWLPTESGSPATWTQEDGILR